jgi:hypothetical protein
LIKRFNKGGAFRAAVPFGRGEKVAVQAQYDEGGNIPPHDHPHPDYTSAMEVLQNLAEKRGGEVTGSSAQRGGFDPRGVYIPATESTAAPAKAIPAGLLAALTEGTTTEDAPEGMTPIQPRGPKVIRTDKPKEILSKERNEIESKQKPQPILFTPSTSNIRVFAGDEDGARLYGGEQDAFAQGFRSGGKDYYATPEAFKKMREAGVNPRDPYAQEFLIELQESNPELFSSEQKHRGEISSMIMSEASQDPQYGRGFFIPKQKIKASF